MSPIFQLQVRAFNLPNYRLFHTPNCYALITIDGERSMKTSPVNGSNPEWTECFDISLNDSSTIIVQLFHVRSTPEEAIHRGTALFQARGLVADMGHGTISHERKLQRTGVDLKYGSEGFVVVSLSRKPEIQASVISTNSKSVIPTSGLVSPIREASRPRDDSEKVPDVVLAEVGRAEASITKLKRHHGTVAEHTSTAASLDLWGSVLGCIERVVQIGDVLSQVHPYAEVAWNMLTIAQKALSNQLTRNNKIRTLLIAIRDMLGFVEDVDGISKISKMQDTVSSMMVEIRECALFIQEYARKGPGMRFLRDNLSYSTDVRIKQFTAIFTNLKWKFDQGINIQTFNTVRKLVPILEDTETEKILERLPGWNLDRVKFKESNACLDGTRRQILDEICEWVDSPHGGCILWLSGGAGTGKTSVANTIAASFDKADHLGASFFFNRDTAGLNSPTYLFGNICYQLAHFQVNEHFQFKSVVLSTVRSMGYVNSSSLRTQARRLIVDTTTAAKLVGPVVIIIDALDESGAMETRKELLDAICAEFPKLPAYVKVMITSRDEPDIRGSLKKIAKEVCIDYAENTPEDITSYIQHRFSTIRQRSHLNQDWPGVVKLQELVSRAGSLFIWATVACNFIEEKRDPVRRLDRLLDVSTNFDGPTESPVKNLDNLYNNILRNAFPEGDDQLADFRYVVGSIIALEVPLSRVELDSLLGLGHTNQISAWQVGHEVHLSSSEEIISPLRSILRVDSKGTTRKDGQLRLLHPSLYEFLTSRVDGNFRIDLLEQHRILAFQCLSVMGSQLKYDICKIGDPSLLNDEVKDLPERINRYISDGLRYACLSIGYHLTKVLNPDSALMDATTKLLSEHLLHWIETMSLLGELDKAESSLHALSIWINDHSKGGFDLEELVKDSIPFLGNSNHVIRRAALHTYYSALSLTPKNVSIFRSFNHHFPYSPTIISSHPTWPPASVRVIEGHASSVRQVVFSQDGTKLVSASRDTTIRIWDVESGQAIGDALKGHSDRISHVVFSPDGKKLASASSDTTVRLWNVDSGQPIGRVLTGHIHWVNHVEFSRDGMKVVSASRDGTLRLWDVDSGLGEILEGHTDGVNHVEYSPDGGKLASASEDTTVRLWDKNGQAFQTLRGHSDCVNRAVFSPDGLKLASASDDNTVRIWNAESGQVIGEPLCGHKHWVNDVVFSPDGRKLASASCDKTVHLWDIQNGQAIGQVLSSHTDMVFHIVFSPDGKRLASASADKTVQLWDVASGRAIGRALQGHANWVNHITFSPDGKKLASASRDRTLRLWDVKNAEVGIQIWKGHTDCVNHVAFSPDGKILVSASDDKELRLWDTKSGQAIGEALRGHTHWVNYVTFSPDGKKLASASHDKTVQLWDVESGCAIGNALEGHADCVTHVAFSQDGKTLISTSDDKVMCFWDVESGKNVGEDIAPYRGHFYAARMVGIKDYQLTKKEPLLSTSHEAQDSDDVKILFDSVHQMEQRSMSFDRLGFLRRGNTRLLWLPVMLRGCVAARSSSVAVGGGSGAVTMIIFPGNV